MPKSTGIPLEERLALIKELAVCCLNNPSYFSDTEGGSLWGVFRAIFDDFAYFSFGWQGKSCGSRFTKLKTIQYVKKVNPELYQMIRPWVENYFGKDISNAD